MRLLVDFLTTYCHVVVQMCNYMIIEQDQIV